MPRIVDKVGDWYYFPLGIAYVSASLKAKGFLIYTLNLNNIDGNIKNIIESRIVEDDIDIVLTGGLSFQINAIKNIISAVKLINSDIPVIVGGGIITSAPEPAMRALEFADYGIIGEGEITNCELASALENKSDCNSVRGIIYRSGDEYVITPPRPEIVDLDSLPYPDYEGFDFSKVLSSVASIQGINEKNAITMLSSRSCPYQCTFCFHSSGKKYRQRSLDNFFEELEYLVGKYGIKYIFVADELFAHKMERVKEFCRRISEYDIKWWAQFRVSDITPELVDLLKSSNCVTMGFGIESADNNILKSMKKGTTVEQIENALKLVYDAGIGIQGGFIFGDVNETIESAKNTLDWWKKNSRYCLGLNFITIYPGTPLYQYAVSKNIISDEVQFIKDACPSINVSKMTHEERKWLAEQIVVLPQKNIQNLNNIRSCSIDYHKGKVSLTGNCVTCGEVVQVFDITFFTRNVLLCPKCNQKHRLPIFQEVVDNIDKNITQALHQYGKVVCWGVNDYFAEIIRSSNVIKNENVFIVDKSELKQGCVLCGKEVFSPSIVSIQKIPYVVVPVVSFFSVIKEEVYTYYSHVKKVTSILELVDFNSAKVLGEVNA